MNVSMLQDVLGGRRKEEGDWGWNLHWEVVSYTRSMWNCYESHAGSEWAKPRKNWGRWKWLQGGKQLEANCGPRVQLQEKLPGCMWLCCGCNSSGG
jgi:hypothetical protein